MLTSIKNFVLDILFPVFCSGCQREGEYICQDCEAILEISEYRFCLCKEPIRLFQKNKCQKCFSKKLNGLFFAVSYQNKLVKQLISQFKYKPYIKELAKPLADLIISHFKLLDSPEYPGCYPGIIQANSLDNILVSVPLCKKKLKQRGYNQSKELARELAKQLKIPIIEDCLLKIKTTLSQTELSEKQRQENVKGAFLYQNIELIKDKKVFLVDDVYTTGSTMQECAKVLKQAGAKQVWGIAIARG